ncbi:WD40 repeat-like protein [Clavulina sp. PMI_390]|nr:WD40 repeat-like protein [Clavulina sp. PMI_390]
MAIPASFIESASYTSKQVKQSRSYRLHVKWNLAGIERSSKATTFKVKAQANGKVEWPPNPGPRRLFSSLPTNIEITVQEQILMFFWKPLSNHHVNSATSLVTTEKAGSMLQVEFTFSGQMAGVVPNEPAIHTPPAANHTNAAVNMVAEAEEVLGPPRDGGLSNAINSQSGNIVGLQDFNPAITAVEGLLKLGDLIAQVHPFVQVIVGVLKGARTIMQAEAQTNERMHNLLDAMKELCIQTKEYATSKEKSQLVQDTIQDISVAVMRGATLIKGYAEHQKRKFPLKPPTFFTVFEQDADKIASTLTAIRSKLIGAAIASVFDNVHRISSELHTIRADIEHLVKTEMLSALPYAADAVTTLHDGNKQGCLPGTRTAILDALQGWGAGASACVVQNPHSHTPTENILRLVDTRVLWLQGVAGSGKSSIAVSVAKFFELTRMYMAYYRFETAKQTQLKPSNLFTTIALQLAAQDPGLERTLLESVRAATFLERKSQDPAEQLKLFLMPLFAWISDNFHRVIIIIDALDESGSQAERKKVLEPLAILADLLPPGVHILITTRPESDIQRALKAPLQLQHATQLFMHDLPNKLTKQDIYQYIKNKLEDPTLEVREDQIQTLSERAQLSFQWASTACRYIVDQDDENRMVLPYERLGKIIGSSSTAGTQTHLYELYTTVMDAQLRKSTDQDLKLPKLLLGVLVVAKKPMSLQAMLQLLQADISQWGDFDIAQRKAAVFISSMSSLITGARADAIDTPLLPLHASFLDFLQDSSTGSKYCVDVARTHTLLTESCFAVMLNRERGLKFNICNLSTSFSTNNSIPKLSNIIQDKIGEALSYACQFWTSHLEAAPKHPDSTLESAKSLLSTMQFFYWLEVMSLTGASPLQSLSLIPDKYTSDFASEVAEAVRFTSYYSIPIAQSAPHIYLSAIPFIPTSSPLHLLCTHFAKTVSISSGKIPVWPPLRHILQHKKATWCLAVSKNYLIAVGLEDGSILLWNCQTGEQLGQQLLGHTDSVLSMAFSPDGRILASGSSDKTVRLWDVESESARGDPFTGHDDSVQSVAFSPNGVVLASGSSDKSIRFWDTVQHSAIGGSLTGHTHPVLSVAFSPDGKVLASGSGDDTIRLWDVPSQLAMGEPLKGHTYSIFSVAFSPDGTILASGSGDRTIRLWDVGSQSAKGGAFVGHTDSVQSVVFSPDGSIVASGSHDNTVRLWNLQSHSVKGEPLTGHNDSVHTVAFSPDGVVLASGSWDNTIRLWDMESQSAKEDAPTGPNDPMLPVSSPSDGTVLASGPNDSTICTWDNASQCLRFSIPTHLNLSHSPSTTPTWHKYLNDGWVRGPNAELILWVPPSYQAHLYDERRITRLGKDTSSRVRLNFSQMVLGESWADCVQPQAN